MTNNPSFVAGEDIESGLILKFGAAPFTVVKATDGSAPLVGVSHEGTRVAPTPGITPMCMLQGESARIYGDTEVCEIIAGGSITAGQLLTADADSKAVPAGSGDYYVGRALSDASAGEMVRAQLQFGQLNVTTTTEEPTTTTTEEPSTTTTEA